MNYELTKKLKDAGFPQKPIGIYGYIGLGYVYCPKCKKCLGSGDDTATAGSGCKECGTTNGLFLIPPTLSQLIEACGDVFCGLNDMTVHDRYHIGGRTVIQAIENGTEGAWSAWAYNKNDCVHGWPKTISVHGNTPEEAVANLWLMLQNTEDKK